MSVAQGVFSMKKNLYWVITAFVVAYLPVADAQQPRGLPRLAILSARSPGPLEIFDAFHQRLRDLGYVPGKNITIEYRFAEDNYHRLPALMAELITFRPDVIFTHTTPGAMAAKQATSTIPIVVGAAGDLVESGIVASLARPGGNITGMTFVTLELDNKRLELLKEAIPKISRVAVLVNPANPVWNNYPQEMEDVARAVRVRLERVEARVPEELQAAFTAMKTWEVDAVLAVSDTVFGAHRNLITELAAKHRLASISERKEFSEAGGLIAYGVDIPEMFRRAAGYVDKILKGAKPANLPLERPKKFEMVVNLKTANEIGLTILPSVLARADKVIK
jgi:putative ABC transport system substrate-binding protein